MTDAERALLLRLVESLDDGLHGYANEGVVIVSLNYRELGKLRALYQAVILEGAK